VCATGRSLTEQGLAFSHGDPSNGNVFVDERGISVLLNSGRGGSADRWLGIAYCVRNIRDDLGPEHESARGVIFRFVRRKNQLEENRLLSSFR
jgi:aminoglycoside phosphotransferase